MDTNDRLPEPVLAREVRGRGLEPQPLSALLVEPTLLVFLRHFG